MLPNLSLCYSLLYLQVKHTQFNKSFSDLWLRSAVHHFFYFIKKVKFKVVFILQGLEETSTFVFFELSCHFYQKYYQNSRMLCREQAWGRSPCHMAAAGRCPHAVAAPRTMPCGHTPPPPHTHLACPIMCHATPPCMPHTTPCSCSPCHMGAASRQSPCPRTMAASYTMPRSHTPHPTRITCHTPLCPTPASFMMGILLVININGYWYSLSNHHMFPSSSWQKLVHLHLVKIPH